MHSRRPLPDARLYRVEGHRPSYRMNDAAKSWGPKLAALRHGLRQVVGLCFAFSPLVAVIALAALLLWTAALSGSP